MLIKFEVEIELPVIRLFCLPERHEEFSNIVCGECRLTKDTHDFEDGPANLEVVLDDGNVFLAYRGATEFVACRNEQFTNAS